MRTDCAPRPSSDHSTDSAAFTSTCGPQHPQQRFEPLHQFCRWPVGGGPSANLHLTPAMICSTRSRFGSYHQCGPRLMQRTLCAAESASASGRIKGKISGALSEADHQSPSSAVPARSFLFAQIVCACHRDLRRSRSGFLSGPCSVASQCVVEILPFNRQAGSGAPRPCGPHLLQLPCPPRRQCVLQGEQDFLRAVRHSEQMKVVLRRPARALRPTGPRAHAALARRPETDPIDFFLRVPVGFLRWGDPRTGANSANILQKGNAPGSTAKCDPGG